VGVNSVTAYDPTEQQFYVVFDGQHEVERIEAEIVPDLGEGYPASSVNGPYTVIHRFRGLR
jgi:hypothetical protein